MKETWEYLDQDVENILYYKMNSTVNLYRSKVKNNPLQMK